MEPESSPESKYHFSKSFHYGLWKEAGRVIERETTPLEKDMLEQHRILLDLTHIPISTDKGEFDPVVGIIGTAQGFDNVHEAFTTLPEVQRKKGAKTKQFLLTGGIGITTYEAKRLGVPGVNAAVFAEMLRQYGVPEEELIIENESKHTDHQSELIAEIRKEKPFSKAIAFLDVWHGPRFFMTMIRRNPDLTIYTKYINRDENSLGAAPYDYGQKRFQAPLHIAEIARLHKYVKEDIGPVTPDKLGEYLERVYVQNGIPFDGKRKSLTRFKELWKSTHEEIIRNADTFLAYR
jgi:hypothetical protein